MVTTIVYIKVKPECVNSFIDATITNHSNSVKEKGNLRFDFLQNPTDHTSFVLYEAYETQTQANAHKETSHYKTWRETVEPFMEQKRIGISYKTIKP